MSSSKPTPNPRIFGIVAREAPKAVIIRRGPSKWHQLLRWNLINDTIDCGQWMHGRVFERRCDLSPDGSLFVYFVSKYGRREKNDGYTETWTAISRPPYYTALALWPKGDSWAGGGLFLNDGTLILNHRPEAAKPHPKHVQKRLKVNLMQDVKGEDDPLYSKRLDMYNWTLRQKWVYSYNYAQKGFKTTSPEIRSKYGKSNSIAIIMTRTLNGLSYKESYDMVSNGNTIQISAEWAEWDMGRERVLFARTGKLFAWSLDSGEQELFDLSTNKPEHVEPPKWASEMPNTCI